MSASLFGERFAGRIEPAWHRLGEVFPQEEKVVGKSTNCSQVFRNFAPAAAVVGALR